MALVNAFAKLRQSTFGLHPTTVECRYAAFDIGSSRYLQLNTYGSPSRQDVDTVSQTLQFDEQSARELKSVLEQEFPG
jgi:hypothetical protein